VGPLWRIRTPAPYIIDLRSQVLDLPCVSAVLLVAWIVRRFDHEIRRVIVFFFAEKFHSPPLI